MTAMFPLASFDVIPNERADAALVAWGHWLGACARPFGRVSFGLENELLAVAVSASTVNAVCGGRSRQDVVELARLCARPEDRDMTRVALRLWRKVAARTWPYWHVQALVSYANAIRHKGDIYRFDGWTKVADVRGGIAGGNEGSWTKGKRYDPKSVWLYSLAPLAVAA